MAFIRRLLPGGKERDGQRIPTTTEVVKAYSPILYIGISRNDIRKYDWDVDVLDEFEQNGFKVVQLAPNKPIEPRVQDLGYLAREELFNEVVREEILSSMPGVERPQGYSFKELLTHTGPIVAKDVREDRGESILYLEDKEAIAKFIAWKFTFSPPEDNNRTEIALRRLKILAAKEAIERNIWDWEGFSQMEPDTGWRFEDYIETPSNYYTSFRIMADGYGKIHYGTLIRSAQEKGVRRIHDPRFHMNSDSTYQHFYNPNSIFYKDAPYIVSNTAQGGIPIQLNGKRIEDPINREVAAAHGIDPDNPQIPEVLIPKASVMGVAMKCASPWTGADFVFNAELQDRFLEANMFPTLSAAGLGVSEIEIRQRVEHPDNHQEVQKYLRKVLVKRLVEGTFRTD